MGRVFLITGCMVTDLPPFVKKSGTRAAILILAEWSRLFVMAGPCAGHL
jgi:hypothetical protein